MVKNGAAVSQAILGVGSSFERMTESPKNIDPVIADIRRPGMRRDAHFHRPVVHLEREPMRPEPRLRLLRRMLVIGITVIAVAVIGGGLFAASNISQAKRLFGDRGGQIADNFVLSLQAFGNMRPAEATQPLEKNAETFTLMEQFLGQNVTGHILSLVGTVIPAVGEGRELIAQVGGLNSNFLAVSSVLGELQTSGFSYFQTDGEKLLALLGRLEQLVADIRNQTRAVKNLTGTLRPTASFFETIDDQLSLNYVKRSSDLAGAERFLSAVTALLATDSDKHVLLLFQNPAELRPGGGFIGSFADLTIRRGQLRAMNVRDVYDTDGQLQENVVPPQPLWNLTERWGARDANWFFDFPLSAKHVVRFLESSGIYTDSDTHFPLAIAVNINVLRSLLETVGPIALPEYKLEITADNFLNEIQREVEAGKDNVAGEPKRILKVLTPILLERLSALTPEQHGQLVGKFMAHFAKKDIMFYAVDPALSDFFGSADLDGAVYRLPNDFWGSYLAVSDANVAGGKTDAVIDQAIEARVDIDTDGGVLTDLSITRTHRGNAEKDAWWKTTNQDYLQVFTNAGSALVGVTGNETKLILPKVDYATSGYTKDPDLESMESSQRYSSAYKSWTGEAFGKTSFSTWTTLAAGKSKTTEFRYQAPPLSDFSLESGKPFRFVFDRQSGVRTTLTVTILAPLGYTWAESQSPIFTKNFGDPDGRVVVDLTLAK
jgi:hypothetical protein